jgi:hypothetical protein
MSKKTIQQRVVTYSDHLSQFDHLPARFVSPCGSFEILKHQAPKFYVGQDNQINFNFDLGLLTNTDTLFKGADNRNDFQLERHCPSIVLLPRETKLTQQWGLSSIARRLQLKHFRHVQTFKSHTTAFNNAYFRPNAKGLVVVKPLDGARGIGQIVANLDEILPSTLAQLLSKANQGSEEFLLAVKEHAPHVEYHVGHGSTFEGTQALASQGYVVQELIPDVVEEYRIILDVDSKPAWFVKRRRDSLPHDASINQHDYRQATGAARVKSEVNFTKIIDYPHKGEVTAALKALHLPFNSVDLFITKDGRWGIFEYCPQWGTDGLPMQEITTWMMDQVATLLKRKERQA